MFLHLGHILGWISVLSFGCFLYDCFGTFLSLAHFSLLYYFSFIYLHYNVIYK